MTNLHGLNIIPLKDIAFEGEHARLGCSSPRWRFCPGSVQEEAGYTDESSAAAIDGTGSHLLLELLLIQWKETEVRPYAEEYMGRIIGEDHNDKPEGWIVKQDRCDRVEMALCYVERRLGELGVTIDHVSAEQRTCPGRFFGRKDWWGTCDITIRGDGILEIADYKDGRGYVSEKDNDQLKDYGLGQMLEDFEMVPDCYHTVRNTIIQPKTGTPIRYVEYKTSDIIEHGYRQAESARKTDDVNAPLYAGKHCQWCLHKPNCNARTAEALEGINNMIMSTEGGSALQTLSSGQIAPVDMTDDQIAQILDAKEIITEMLKQVGDEAQSRLEAGKTITGYAMGSSRGSSKWSDDEEVIAKKLTGLRVKKADIYPAKFISPAQALKLPGLTDKQKARIKSEMIAHVAGKPTVVKSNTKVEKSASEMFADVPVVPVAPSTAPAATSTVPDVPAAPAAPAAPQITFL